MVILILIGAMLLVGVPLYIQYRISGSPSANKPMPRSQSSWHHHHPTSKTNVPRKAKSNANTTQNANATDTAPLAASANVTTSETAKADIFQSSTDTEVTINAQVQGAQSTQSQSTLKEQKPQEQPAEEEAEVCCGLHEVCEKLATNSTKIEYFEDEELDVFAGRDPQSYNDQEIDQFRDVMTTMYPSEVALWRQSLQLRGVALPVELEDEFMLILSEV